MKKLFDNPKKVVYAIVVFLILLVTLFAISDRGNASDLYIEGGSAVVRGYTPALGLDINFPRAGPVNTDYEIGFLLSGQSTKYRDNPNAFTLYALLVDGYKNFEAGIGFAFTPAEWEYTCHETFALMARWRFTPRIATQWRHFSSAGSCKPNAGRDFLTLSYRF